MANHNHLSSATCYNVAMHKHDYYNQFFELGQQKINFKFYELSLPDDDPVFTLKNVMEEMDFTALLAQYSGKGKSGFNPIMKYGVLTYANMRGIREVDRIVELCKRDLAFIWLTQGEQPKRDAFYGEQTSFIKKQVYLRHPGLLFCQRKQTERKNSSDLFCCRSQASCKCTAVFHS